MYVCVRACGASFVCVQRVLSETGFDLLAPLCWSRGGENHYTTAHHLERDLQFNSNPCRRTTAIALHSYRSYRSYYSYSTSSQTTDITMKCVLFACAIMTVIVAFSTAWQAWPDIADFGVVSNPLNVTIYYDSHCSESQTFIRDQLVPNFCKIQKYINLRLIAFSKPYKSTKGFICQYGFTKCMSNIVHNCVLNRIEDSAGQVNYLNCAMSDLKIPGKIDKLCVKKSGLSIDDVNNCFTTQEGYNLNLMAEIETRVMTYAPTFVPTIVFDNKFNDRNQRLALADFESALCEKFTDRGFTNVCANGMILNPKIC